uniref:C-type lectin domain-containing protein n=1 Tax=Glossina brevipalpis TaxID=37001 RepID=A0A1A9W341_9MUSC
MKAAIIFSLIFLIHQCNAFGERHVILDYLQIYVDTEFKGNWFQAWHECASRNMTLIALDSEEKNKALEHALKKDCETDAYPRLWLGGTDLGAEGQYVWASTGKPFDYVNWSPGNPDNDGGYEHCAYIWEKTDFQWNDGDCTIKMGFICEDHPIKYALHKSFEEYIWG